MPCIVEFVNKRKKYRPCSQISHRGATVELLLAGNFGLHKDFIPKFSTTPDLKVLISRLGVVSFQFGIVNYGRKQVTVQRRGEHTLAKSSDDSTRSTTFSWYACRDAERARAIAQKLKLRGITCSAPGTAQKVPWNRTSRLNRCPLRTRAGSPQNN